jgi:hypothetical protein
VIDYGVASSTIRATPATHQMVVTEHGWSANSVSTFYYNGGQQTGTFGAGGGAVHETYQCTSNTLTLLTGGKVADTETRVSRTP